MNYTINKTLISVLILAIVVLLTATHVNAQSQRANECFQLRSEVLEGTVDADLGTIKPLNLNEESHLMKFGVDSMDDCAQHGRKVSYQFYYIETTEDGRPQKKIALGKRHTAIADLGIVTLKVPGDDWRKSFTNKSVSVFFDQASIGTEVGHHLSYTAERNSTKSIGRDSGGLRPGYITCVVAERGTCGTVNHDARTVIGMSTDSSTETEKVAETTPAETQKPTVVRVEKDTTETVETDERSTVIAQDDTADQDETADSENTSPVSQLKYPVAKKGRLMSDVDYFG